MGDVETVEILMLLSVHDANNILITTLLLYITFIAVARESEAF